MTGDDELWAIAHAQAERLRHLRAHLHRAPRGDLLASTRGPEDIRHALREARGVVDGLLAPLPHRPDPAALREEAAAFGALDATHLDLSFRQLFPGLDLGVYVASHATGKPSIAARGLAEVTYGPQHLGGIDAWDDGGWFDLLDAFERASCELLGRGREGDAAWFSSVSDALHAVLDGLPGGVLVEDGAHFPSARYLHAQWAERRGGRVERVEPGADGVPSTEALIAALGPKTAVVSVSHAAYASGYLHDLDALGAAMRATCPDAALIVDAYQTVGTVPIEARGLPERTAVLAGGVKQLGAGPGTAVAWGSAPLLGSLAGSRSGWWAHRDPLAFAAEFEPGDGAARLRSGTPSIVGAAALLTSLRALAASAGGDLPAAIRRARARTREHVASAVARCRRAGLEVLGGDDPERRAAFLAVRVRDGDRIVDMLAREGVVADHRPLAPGQDVGVIRLSSSAASFGYELSYAVDRLARYAR